ncbi:hypothetical protein B484DRAFT_288189 [Ochromonadaceae sp. CCMP2298]|nr:hypothetical protein B484DRAFT_288189 [Ochromonadaceae sp. CCMP2298]
MRTLISIQPHPHEQAAVTAHRLPLRIRCDKGGENVLVADFMLEKRGTANRPVLTGSSKHNTRIERLWRDVRTHVLQRYMDLFSVLVDDDVLDPEDPVQRWTLHHIFLPLIEADLQQYIQTWNNHKVRTEHNKTPLQLLFERADQAVPEVHVDEEYGAEGGSASGTDSDSEEEPAAVVAPGVLCPFDNTIGLATFTAAAPPLMLSDSVLHYRPHFCHALQLVHVHQQGQGQG